MKMNRLLMAVLIIGGAYAALVIIFDTILHEPVPASVIKMYMFFIIVSVLMVMTSSEESSNELWGPLISLVYDPSRRGMRNIVFVIVPIVAALITYDITKPTLDAPVELRTVHPAPPSSIKVYGKKYNLLSLENPLRHLEKDDPAKFKEAVQEGRTVFFQNCFYCHGDYLNGKGMYAIGFNNPLPANFQDVGTIAQLQEAFLFWRITTGGPGLPNEGTPWLSPMPVWQNFLKEEEVWKVIMFLYDYTGHSPRVMKEEGEEH